MPVITAFGGSTGKRSARVVIGTTNAGYTASDVDFLCNGSNDSAMFASALTSISAVGGEIKILDGTYILSKPWAIERNNIKVTGSGAGITVLRMTGTRNSSAAAADAKSNNAVVYLSGSNNAIEGLTLANGMSPTVGVSYGIYVAESNHVTVTGTLCDNASSNQSSHGIFFNGCTDCVADYNTVSNSTGASVNCFGITLDAAFSDNNAILDNTVENSGNGTVFGVYLNYSSSHNVIRGNRVSTSAVGTSGSCYGVYLNSENCSNVIEGNIFTNTSAGTTAGNSYCRGVSMTGNSNGNSVIANTFTNSAVLSSFGVDCNGSKNNVIAGNTISNSDTGNGNEGILLIGTASYNVVQGNIISNSTSALSSRGIDNNAPYNVISGNVILNSNSGSATNDLCYGILSSGDHCTITGNVIANNSAVGICYGMYLSGSDNNSVTGNTVSNGSSGGYAYGIYLANVTNSRVSCVFGGKSATFTGFALYIIGTGNTYNQITNNNYRNWGQYGSGLYTSDGSVTASLPGSATTISTFTIIGTGSVSGFDMR
ncbi:MAG: right-handed parallel beta-helix repeat-containing protein [Oscillospiraceae bacterium]|jgi:parallel beta-helix repeat protein|nr:right-handed parallel beta-helix repeat-containing protein [Oscillospiraceae bacterium]